MLALLEALQDEANEMLLSGNESGATDLLEGIAAVYRHATWLVPPGGAP